jgi:hypothetical protein
VVESRDLRDREVDHEVAGNKCREDVLRRGMPKADVVPTLAGAD